MERLTNIGFDEVGSWHISNGSLMNNISPQNGRQRGILYAFVHITQVMYIGKTTDKLKNRMNGYKNAGGNQRTNIRLKHNIIDLLNLGESVRIFILIDNIQSEYMGYRLSLASGLEDTLIASLQPEWNYRGNNRILEQEMPSIESGAIVESNQPVVGVVRTVEITLRDHYYNNGRFNFSVDDLPFLPANEAHVTIFLGEGSDYFIQGRYHLTGANGNQPRIDGNRALRDWFQNNFNLGDQINVDIIDSHTFQIRFSL